MAKHRKETGVSIVIGAIADARAKRELQADGRNRALRTFIVNLAADVVVALAMLLAPIITAAQSWGDLQWSVIGFLVFKTALATLFSYLLRTVVDPSRVPSPRPPSDETGSAFLRDAVIAAVLNVVALCSLAAVGGIR